MQWWPNLNTAISKIRGKAKNDFLMVKNSVVNISLANPRPKFIVLALGRVKSLPKRKLGMLVE